MLAGLPYVVWPVGSLFILASRKRDDPFLHYHAVQGGIFGAAALMACVLGTIALAITFRILPGSSTYLPGVLGMGTLFGGGAIAMLIFFTAIFLGWRATEGEMLRLPFAGDYAEGKMLDHTGMTRREFMQMLEESFIEPNADEPEPIPFPQMSAPAAALSGRAAEVMAARAAQDATPASLKAAEILARRQAQQAAAQQQAAQQQAALQAAQQAANLAAQQAAALQAATQRSAAQQGARPGGSPPVNNASRPAAPNSTSRPAAAANTPRPSAAPANPQKPAARQPATAAPQPIPVVQDPRVKSYPLIGGTAPTAQRSHVLEPSPQQRSAQPPQKAQTPSGWQQSPGQASRPPQQAPTGQVKDVDLVRHYKERQKPDPPSDALRNWLTSVDEG